MSKPPLLVYDTLDDRREIAVLLRRLPPARRLAWLDWCCRQATLKTNRGIRPKVTGATRRLAEKARWDDSADERLLVECWTDAWMIAAQYAFDMDAAVTKLVEMVRRPA